MATYRITDPQTGRIFRITGNNPPTENQIRMVIGAASGEPQLRAAPGPAFAMPTLPSPELPAPPGQLTEEPGKRAEQITQLLSALVGGGMSALPTKGVSLLRPPGAVSG